MEGSPEGGQMEGSPEGGQMEGFGGISHFVPDYQGLLTRGGEDATNELSRLFVELMDRLRTRQPNYHARLHAGSPADFRARIASALVSGAVSPALYNDRGAPGRRPAAPGRSASATPAWATPAPSTRAEGRSTGGGLPRFELPPFEPQAGGQSDDEQSEGTGRPEVGGAQKTGAGPRPQPRAPPAHRGQIAHQQQSTHEGELQHVPDGSRAQNRQSRKEQKPIEPRANPEQGQRQKARHPEEEDEGEDRRLGGVVGAQSALPLSDHRSAALLAEAAQSVSHHEPQHVDPPLQKGGHGERDPEQDRREPPGRSAGRSAGQGVAAPGVALVGVGVPAVAPEGKTFLKPAAEAVGRDQDHPQRKTGVGIGPHSHSNAIRVIALRPVKRPWPSNR